MSCSPLSSLISRTCCVAFCLVKIAIFTIVPTAKALSLHERFAIFMFGKNQYSTQKIKNGFYATKTI